MDEGGAVIDILVKALALIAIIGIGLGIKRLGWARTEDVGLFAKLVLRVTLPCALASAFNDFTITASLLVLSALGLVVNLIQQTSGYTMGRTAEERAFGVLNVNSYNMGAFATPYLAGFMGPQTIVYSAMFDVGNALGAAGVGYAWSSSLARGVRLTPWQFVKLMFSSVIFDVYLFLVIMRLFDLHLPAPILTFTSLVGSANTFLAMLMIGIGLELRLPNHKYAAAARYLGVRYGWAIVFALLTWFLLPLDHPSKVVLTMVYFAPIASMIPGFTQENGGDVELSSFMNSISIVVAMISMPLLAAVVKG